MAAFSAPKAIAEGVPYILNAKKFAFSLKNKIKRMGHFWSLRGGSFLGHFGSYLGHFRSFYGGFIINFHLFHPVIHFHPYHPTSSFSMHYHTFHPLPSVLMHFPPSLFIFLHFYQFSSILSTCMSTNPNNNKISILFKISPIATSVKYLVASSGSHQLSRCYLSN